MHEADPIQGIDVTEIPEDITVPGRKKARLVDQIPFFRDKLDLHFRDFM